MNEVLVTNLLWVGAGGFLGAVSRYLVGGLVHRLLPVSHMPYGTLVVNVAGCLLIGWLGALAETRGLFSGTTRLLVFIGVLGGFTTFSTFAFETLALTRQGETVPAAANVALHLVLCLAAVTAGDAVGRALWR
jgi:CrcB protein